ncbi:hypothetical protein DXX93_12175 [Thalassotalea euphylliae]|uniref:Uncharacterized protein n=1 Tax=Thalassotalea euphylliae TaxID=1655234 RepID=A0A3E0TSD9_9GAMM|nr:DUF6176 family protein [Thalassotalea euphylliae]REL27247.1 hypothetical protein DXX93_12175 [Thalassotalea euphylliae]
MESKLLKIKLKAGSRADLDSLVAYMRENIAHPRDEMSQKGYFWDSIFIEQTDKADFLYIVIKSEDFSTIMVDESELSLTPFRQVYDDFKTKCWLPEPYEDLEPVFCFNSAMQFSNN